MKSIGRGVVTWSYNQYRANAQKEYDNFWSALFRELIQNSSDAGARLIKFSINDDEIICDDDGCGMTLDIIQNKLLVIGGSEKAYGSVGGLGKAKELLFFSWPEWSIQTSGHTVVGSGGEYEIFESDLKRGTKVRLRILEDDVVESIEAHLHNVATSCYIKAKMTSGDKLLKPSMPRGSKVRTIDDLGTLYCLKTHAGQPITEYKVGVSINGVWMFDKWVGEHRGHITLDIDPSESDPARLVTGSRDSLKYEYGQRLDELIRELTVDRRSALVRRESTISLIKGDGEIYVPPSDAEIDDMADALGQVQVDRCVDELKQIFDHTDDLNVERVSNSLKNVSDLKDLIRKYEQILNYEPDFIIYEDASSWTTSRIRTFMKTQKASTIAQVWTETVKQVLWDNNISTRFTAGFVFDTENEAIFMRRDGKEYYLINPRLTPPAGIQNKVYFMNYMRTNAVHEITHRYEKYHDEDFVYRYHELERNTWRSHRVYAKIGKIRGGK